MTNDLETLARRAVACRHWRWMPGMLSDKGLRITRCDDDGYVVGYYEHLSYIAECVKGSTPDLADPATLGCLLALVREAWDRPYTWVEYTSRWEPFYCQVRMRGFIGATEAEALVAALEAAP